VGKKKKKKAKKVDGEEKKEGDEKEKSTGKKGYNHVFDKIKAEKAAKQAKRELDARRLEKKLRVKSRYAK
jgi:hypothetical protein